VGCKGWDRMGSDRRRMGLSGQATGNRIGERGDQNSEKGTEIKLRS